MVEPTAEHADRVTVLDASCRWLAVIGAVVLVALSMITVVSVIGRYLFGQPVHGDFELVEMGCALAVSLFLPYCQLRSGNVIVDFVTMRAPTGVKRLLDAFGCLLISIMGGVLAWRLMLGGYDLYRYNDQTMV
ncbi:MAG: TRAP transporter small permease, partial [Proteobacteria bacterium]